MPDTDKILKRTLEKTAAYWHAFPHLTDNEFIADFTQHLYWRLGEPASEQLIKSYLEDFEVPLVFLQDILANRFPLFHAAQQLVLNSMQKAATGQRHICLLDIGSGRGAQLARLLQSLKNHRKLDSVTVIATDIREDSLKYCTDYIHSIKHQFPFNLLLYTLPCAAEKMEIRQLHSLVPGKSGCLLVNAYGVLHHVQEEKKRTELFRQILSLEPTLVSLIEPDTDCFTNDTELRFQNAYQHFGSLYSYISQLPLSAEEIKGLKQFFRNELYDCLVLPDEKRVEKYSTGDHWIALATAAGLKVKPLLCDTRVPDVPSIKMEEMPAGYFRFSYSGSPLLSVVGFGI